jgi:ligand-binding sensor domain-containing protein
MKTLKLSLLIIFSCLSLFSNNSSDWSYLRDVNSIRKMCLSDGKLFLGTENGLAEVDTTFSTYRILGPYDGFFGNRVTALIKDRSGKLWYSTLQGYIGVLNGSSFNTFTGFSNENLRINDLITDGDKIWVATSKGLARFKPVDGFVTGLIEVFVNKIGTFSVESEVKSLFIDGDTLYVGMNSGLAKISLSNDLMLSSNWTTIPLGRGVNAIKKFRGDYILGMEKVTSTDLVSSILRLRNGRVDTLFQGLSQTRRVINDIFVHNDTLWVVGSSEEDARDPHYIFHDGVTERLRTLGVNSTYSGCFSVIDFNGRLLYGLRYSGVGFKSHDTGLIEPIRFQCVFGSDFTDVVFKGDSISLLSKNIGATIIDRSGYSHRIRFFQTATYTDSIVQLALRTSKTVNIDNRGVLWLGSKEKSGLVKNYPDGRWRYFNYSNSMLCGHDNGGDYTFIDVTDIVSDSSGNMWVTQHNPANHYPILVFGSDNLDGDPIWKINSFSSPLDNIAKVKCLDVRGTRFWGGTDDLKVFGVNFRENLLDSLRYTWYYYRDDEIPGTEINDIAIDSKQHVWVAASGGLSRMNQNMILLLKLFFLIILVPRFGQ